MVVTKEIIKKRAESIKALRFRVKAEEQRLGLEVWKFLAPRGSMRDLAKEMKISAQYLCDISRGRRKVSDAVIEKLMAL